MSRARILSLFVALIALSAAFAACGGSSSNDPQSIVEEATLKGVESGKLALQTNVAIKGGEKSGNLDVELNGPFQGESESETPELDLSLALNGKLGGEKIDREGGLTLLDNKAYVAYEGTEYEVDATTFNFVKAMLKKQGVGQSQSGESKACQEVFSELEFSNFVENLKNEGSADVGGTSTTKVSGDLKSSGVAEIIDELNENPACKEQLSQAQGALPSTAELEQAKNTIEDSIKSAHVDLYVGDDHIIRRVSAQVEVEPPKGSEGGAKQVDVNLDLSLTGVNEEQTIAAPSGAKPLNDLFLKLGINPLELLGALQNGGNQGLGSLLEKLGGSSSSAGGSSGGQQSYYECLGEAHTPVDMQSCRGLLQ